MLLINIFYKGVADNERIVNYRVQVLRVVDVGNVGSFGGSLCETVRVGMIIPFGEMFGRVDGLDRSDQ